jgi:uncharacterized membrane protein
VEEAMKLIVSGGLYSPSQPMSRTVKASGVPSLSPKVEVPIA